MFQDYNGNVWVCSNKPKKGNYGEWLEGCDYKFIISGLSNQNWRNTLIDLDKDDYDFEDGILRRIDR